MAAQLDYNFETPKGFPGGKYDLAFDEVISRTVESASGAMKFGTFITKGTDARKQCKVLDNATAADVLGVCLNGLINEHSMEGDVVVRRGQTVGVVRHGNVWCRFTGENAPVAGGVAYIVASGENAGFVTADGTDAIDIGATFIDVDAENEIAAVTFDARNIPAQA